MIEGAEGAEDSDEDMMDDEETDDEKSHSKKVHVSVITGFLGSGKSTVSRNRCRMCLCNITAHHVLMPAQIFSSAASEPHPHGQDARPEVCSHRERSWRHRDRQPDHQEKHRRGDYRGDQRVYLL